MFVYGWHKLCRYKERLLQRGAVHGGRTWLDWGGGLLGGKPSEAYGHFIWITGHLPWGIIAMTPTLVSVAAHTRYKI